MQKFLSYKLKSDALVILEQNANTLGNIDKTLKVK